MNFDIMLIIIVATNVIIIPITKLFIKLQLSILVKLFIIITSNENKEPCIQ